MKMNLLRVCPFWSNWNESFYGNCKMRAGRMIWAKLVKQFRPKDDKSLALRTHCQTSGWSLTEQDPFNNVAGVYRSCRCRFWWYTVFTYNALDEAIALPTDFSARIRNTQLLFTRKKLKSQKQ
jgi:methylmalonyl-CoA mutase